MAESAGDRIEQQIRTAARNDTLSHAIVLRGGTAARRAELGRLIAQSMQCSGESKPCGLCPGCRKVLAGIHPDVIFVRDDEHKTLPMEVVRAACADASIRPNEGRRKIYIYEDCAKLDAKSQDVLLKTVEDGPAYAAFLFYADSTDLILSTILSRCVELKLPGDEAADRAAVDRAAELADILCQLREDALAAYFCALENARPSREELAAFLGAARELFAAALLEQYGRSAPEELAESARALANRLTKEQLMGIIEILQKDQTASERINVGVGHMLGGLSAELAAFLSRA